MDPNTNLEEQRRIIARMWAEPITITDALRLAELAEALDDWIKGGGFLPGEWQHKVIA